MTKENSANHLQLSFHAQGKELLGIYIVHAIFILFTLGIYYFWAKVKVLEFLYNNTELMDHSFFYHGTGKERFFGFIKGVALIALILAPLIVLGLVIGFAAESKGSNNKEAASLAIAVVLIPTLILLLFIVPFIFVAKERYRLSRSSWRNIRFCFTGKVKDLLGWGLVGAIITMLTVGLGYPWYRCKLKKYFTDHSYFGNQPFGFNGQWVEFMGITIGGILLTGVTLGIGYFWWKAWERNFFWNHTTFQGKNFCSQIRGFDYLKVRGVGIIITLLTLGIASPIALVMKHRLFIKSISYNGEPDFSSIEGGLNKETGALAESLFDLVT